MRTTKRPQFWLAVAALSATLFAALSLTAHADDPVNFVPGKYSGTVTVEGEQAPCWNDGYGFMNGFNWEHIQAYLTVSPQGSVLVLSIPEGNTRAGDWFETKGGTLTLDKAHVIGGIRHHTVYYFDVTFAYDHRFIGEWYLGTGTWIVKGDCEAELLYPVTISLKRRIAAAVPVVATPVPVVPAPVHVVDLVRKTDPEDREVYVDPEDDAKAKAEAEAKAKAEAKANAEAEAKAKAEAEADAKAKDAAALAVLAALLAGLAALSGITIGAEDGLPLPALPGTKTATVEPPEEHWTMPQPPSDGGQTPPPLTGARGPGGIANQPLGEDPPQPAPPEEHWTMPLPPTDGGQTPPPLSGARGPGGIANQPLGEDAPQPAPPEEHWTMPQPPTDGDQTPPPLTGARGPGGIANQPLGEDPPQPAPPEEHWTMPLPKPTAADQPATPAMPPGDHPHTVERENTGAPRTAEASAPVDPHAITPAAAAALQDELRRAQEEFRAAQAAYDASAKGDLQRAADRLTAAKMDLQVAESHQAPVRGTGSPAGMSEEDFRARERLQNIAREREVVDSLPPDQRELASRPSIMAGQEPATPYDPTIKAPEGPGKTERMLLDKLADVDQKLAANPSYRDEYHLNRIREDTVIRLDILRKNNLDADAVNRYDNAQNRADLIEQSKEILRQGVPIAGSELLSALSRTPPGERAVEWVAEKLGEGADRVGTLGRGYNAETVERAAQAAAAEGSAAQRTASELSAAQKGASEVSSLTQEEKTIAAAKIQVNPAFKGTEVGAGRTTVNEPMTGDIGKSAGGAAREGSPDALTRRYAPGEAGRPAVPEPPPARPLAPEEAAVTRVARPPTPEEAAATVKSPLDAVVPAPGGQLYDQDGVWLDLKEGDPVWMGRGPAPPLEQGPGGSITPVGGRNGMWFVPKEGPPVWHGEGPAPSVPPELAPTRIEPPARPLTPAAEAAKTTIEPPPGRHINPNATKTTQFETPDIPGDKPTGPRGTERLEPKDLPDLGKTPGPGVERGVDGRHPIRMTREEAGARLGEEIEPATPRPQGAEAPAPDLPRDLPQAKLPETAARPRPDLPEEPITGKLPDPEMPKPELPETVRRPAMEAAPAEPPRSARFDEAPHGNPAVHAGEKLPVQADDLGAPFKRALDPDHVPQVLESDLRRYQEAVVQARAAAGGRTGPCEVASACLRKELGGDVVGHSGTLAGAINHEYVLTKEGLVLDPVARQVVEKGLVTPGQIRAAGLMDAVDKGVFTPAQWEKFNSLGRGHLPQGLKF